MTMMDIRRQAAPQTIPGSKRNEDNQEAKANEMIHVPMLKSIGATVSRE